MALFFLLLSYHSGEACPSNSRCNCGDGTGSEVSGALLLEDKDLDLGCFLGRNIDLGGSFPTHDLKSGQFCDSTKNFGPPKFCCNFSEIFRFFF